MVGIESVEARLDISTFDNDLSVQYSVVMAIEVGTYETQVKCLITGQKGQTERLTFNILNG